MVLYTTQGSDMMSYDIFMNLEQADSTELFRSNANMIKYRYLPQQPSEPGKGPGLPVGWVKNTYQGEDYIGFTCAACHTAQINYNGTGIRVDGGPAMADMNGCWRIFRRPWRQVSNGRNLTGSPPIS